MIVDFGETDPARAKRIARRLSRCLPQLWFTLDDGVLYLRDPEEPGPRNLAGDRPFRGGTQER